MRGVLLMAMLSACGPAPAVETTPEPSRTCLVLSVGSAKGMAHVGAIQAIQDEGVSIDCVVGNSAGALVGSLYASAPDVPIAERVRSFLERYEDATRSEARRRGLGLGALALLTGGGALAAGAAGLFGAATTERVQHERFVEVLDETFEHGRVGETPIPFRTFWIERSGDGIQRVESPEGELLAQAVGASIANPYVFEDVSLRETRRIDPGADRVSATPVEDACEAFPDARFIVVNVTGSPPFTSANMRCPYVEIRVDAGDVDAEEVMRRGDAFDRVLAEGRRATCDALRLTCGAP